MALDIDRGYAAASPRQISLASCVHLWNMWLTKASHHKGHECAVIFTMKGMKDMKHRVKELQNMKKLVDRSLLG